MSSKHLESVFDLQWKPRLFIEANAGTGKTYTIVGLFVRLLIEKRLTIDQVLVMTFTKKATAELRDRIFQRLRETIIYLQTGEKEEKEFMEGLEKVIVDDDRDKIIYHLREAIQNFDESQVYTIHSFCQKILREEALLGGAPFDVEVVQQDEMMIQAAEDEWRLFVANHQGTDAEKYYARKLFKLAENPAALIQLLKPIFSRSYAELEGEGHSDPIGYLEAVIKAKKELVECWKSDEEKIRKIIKQCELSRFQQYLPGRLNKLEAFIFDENHEIDAPGSLAYFTAEYLYNPNNLPKAKKHLRPEKHLFFELCQQYSDLIQEMDQVNTRLIKELYERILKRRDELSRVGNTVTYDDLLKKVNHALNDPETGEKLAGRILEKYPFALVDEFQDTDPIQYGILDTIYPANGSDLGLMMIGDPKQAIYAFRGADIYTYLRAKNKSDGEPYSLQQNFRSSPDLIEAVNKLFNNENKPFIEEDIKYLDSKAGKPERADHLIINGEIPVPLTITLHEEPQEKKDHAKNWAFAQTIKKIVRLLRLSQEGLATIEGKPIKAADIAVLVNSHKDAAQIKMALKRFGVGAVTYSHEKVFETFEANRLELLMDSVLEPNQSRKVNSALLTGFFGLSLNEIHSLKSDEIKRQALLEGLQELNIIWKKSGFYSMFRKVMFGQKSLSTLAELDFSERILTNMMQLADIVSKAEKEGGLSPLAVLNWFRKQMADPNPDDEKTLLLESDQNLVKISTIHNSKGLQFPIVFCPALWSGFSNSNKSPFVVYNNRDKDKTVVNFDQSESESRLSALESSKLESVAEEVRKLYVALTRAQYYCSIYWVSHTDSHFSGLGASLLGRESVMKKIGGSKKDIVGDNEFYLKSFRQLSATHPVLLSVLDEDIEDIPPLQKIEEEGDDLTVKVYEGRLELPVQRKLDSFSSLTHQKTEAGMPDYDQMIQSYSESLEETMPAEKVLDIFSFPKGATAGTAIHKLFEIEQFDFTTATELDLTDEIGEILEFYRIDRKWAPLMQKMMENTASSVISDLQLNRVRRENQLREMEFHFPSAGSNSENLFKTIRNGIGRSTPVPVVHRGYMTGFIDLIVEQGGRFYILDYKSNYLGDSREEYGKEKLNQAMLEAGYDLQAYIYTVALVKYLRHRLPDFDYDRHVGGVAYLFVRGMQKGSDNGVWFHKPDRQVVAELEIKLTRK